MCSAQHFIRASVISMLFIVVQHAAKHALWALSQQALPAAVLQPEIMSCCALLLQHMQLPVTSHTTAAATRWDTTLSSPQISVNQALLGLNI